MREHDVAYIAGVIDSDGYITIHKNTSIMPPIYSPRIGINQVEPQAVLLAKELFGGNIQIVSPDHFGRKSMYYWQLGSNGLIEALRELIPFMRIKKEQALIALRLQENIREWKGKVRGVRGQRSPVLPPDVIEFREKCYQDLRAARLTPAAETKSRDFDLDRGKDAIVRTPTMQSKLERQAEMTCQLA